jgi:hypothetical protein
VKLEFAKTINKLTKAMAQKLLSSKTLLLGVLCAFVLYTTVGCQHVTLVQDPIYSKHAVVPAPTATSRLDMQKPLKFAQAGSSDSTQSTASSTADDMRVTNRTGLTILAVGAVVLIIATPLILSQIFSSGSRQQDGQNDKVGISVAPEVQGH